MERKTAYTTNNGLVLDTYDSTKSTLFILRNFVEKGNVLYLSRMLSPETVASMPVSPVKVRDTKQENRIDLLKESLKRAQRRQKELDQYLNHLEETEPSYLAIDEIDDALETIRLTA